jgi:hypothetical protein
MRYDVQVRSLEEAQNNKLWEGCHLKIQILVRPVKAKIVSRPREGRNNE